MRSRRARPDRRGRSRSCARHDHRSVRGAGRARHANDPRARPPLAQGGHRVNDTSRDALIVVDLQRGFDDHKHVPANHCLEETRSRPARSRARSPHRCTASSPRSSTRTKHWTTECTLASRRLSPSRPHECHPPSPRFPDACKPRATDVRRAHVEVDLDLRRRRHPQSL